MTYKSIKRTTLKIFFTLILFVSFFCCKNYAATSTPSNLTNSLTRDELGEIQDYSDLQEMVVQIFDVNTNMGTEK